MDTVNLKNCLNDKIQALQEPETRSISMNQITERATIPDSKYLALTNNALDIIGENLKHQPLSHQLFDIVKPPSGGGIAFTVPGLSGDEMEKELTGIILDYTTPRAYWDTPDPVEGTPPVCYSKDSLISTEGKSCAHCPFNDFGSKDGETNAKACKESVELFLLRPDNIMPVIVRIPVSSKRIFQRYMTRLISRMIPISGVVTKITLEKATSKTGQPYAQYHFEAVETLTSEDAANAKAFGKKFMEILDASDFEPDLRDVG